MNRKKSRLSRYLAVLMLFALVLSLWTPSAVQAADIKNYAMTNDENLLSRVKSLAKKVSDTNTVMVNRKYPDYFCVGEKIVFGVNLTSQVGTYANEIIRVTNYGNKKLKFYGVKIGAKRKTVISKMYKYQGLFSSILNFGNGNVWSIGNAGSIEFFFNSKDKVAGWTLVFAFTG